MIGIHEPYAIGGQKIPALLETVCQIFAEKGELACKLGLEHRPQQAHMAECVIECFLDDRTLLFEAGTGVGKSLAYLIPGILQSIAADRPLVVSSHTIALQEQLENKDLHLCRQLFRKSKPLNKYADFKHALLVGRGNYLCGTRLHQALETRTELFPGPEQKELQRITDWAGQTQTGLITELDPQPLREVWEWVNSDGSACNNRNCKSPTCFYRKALVALRQAQVIIVNHSLLMALLASGMSPGNKTRGVLFPKDFLVIDEAHTLPAVAAEHFGLRISSYGLRRQLLRLHNPRRKKARGLLHRYGTPALCRQVEVVLTKAEIFFGKILEQHLQQRSCVRLIEADWNEPLLDEPLSELIAGIRKKEHYLEDGPGKDELTGLRESLEGYRGGLEEARTLSDPDAVYWIERSGRRESIVHIRSAPVDVAPDLKKHIFQRNTGVLLTSATLADGPDMRSFQKKAGATEAQTIQEFSPFNYRKNVSIYIAEDAPTPQPSQAEAYRQYLAETILVAVRQTEGGSLVLFTSYQDLNACEKRLRLEIENKQNRPLLCQNIDGPRTAIVQRMRETGNAVVFGTDSFWTGVDVAGPALSQVIITRLPFQNPSHPIAEARHERCRRQGGNPFMDITLPEALIQFRQGLGRLIRTVNDTGNLIILDSRMLVKMYGKAFQEVLPHDNFTPFNLRNIEAKFTSG